MMLPGEDPAPAEDESTIEGMPDNFDTEIGYISNVAKGEAPVPRRIGPLEMRGKLGEGGMGIVYRAHHVELNSDVAVKFLSRNEESRRFLHEARTMAKLSHPGIVKIYHVDFSGDTPYMIMDLIRGETLSAVIQKGLITPRRALHLCVKICRVIEYAHSENVIHRDLKPDNIMIVSEQDNKWEIRVMDFGLAMLHDTNLTRSGSILGTPSYMSPEQAQGWREAIGERSDVYSLGAVLYQMLTGMPPFAGESIPEILYKVVHSVPLSPRLLNPAVDKFAEAICLKAMDKTPRRRYQSAAEMAEDLESFLEGRPISAKPLGPIRAGWLWVRRHRWSTLALLSLLALLSYLGFEAFFPGAVVFDGFPAGSRMHVDAGEPTTLTPGGRVWLRPGYHRVVLVHPKFEPYEFDLHLRAGRTQQHLQVEMIPAYGGLRITARPVGARISVRPGTEGAWQTMGLTTRDRTLRLRNGAWQVRLDKPGYEVALVARVIDGGRTTHIERPLVPRTAMVRLEGGPGEVGLRLVHRSSGESRRFTSSWSGSLRVGWHDVYASKQNFFPKGPLGFHVRAFDAPARERQVNVLRILLTSRDLWQYHAGTPVTRLVSAELTNDGCPDFVALGADHTLHAVDGFFGRSLWRHRLGQRGDLLLATPDLTGDGGADLLLATSDSILHCYAGRQARWDRVEPAWKASLKQLRSISVVRDQDRDGTPDLLLGLGAGTLEIYSGRSGKRLRILVSTVGGRLIEHVSSALDPDDSLDHIVLLQDKRGANWLKSYSGVGGRLLWEIRLSGSEPTPLAVGDMNKDGIADVLYAARSANSRGTLFVHDGRDGALLHATPIGRRITSRPTVAPPVKGLGPLVGVGSWGRSFTLLDGAGKEVWENQSTTGWILQPGAVGDMDGDGRREVVFGATDRRLRVVARDGASWDYLTPGALQAPPLLRDLDWDGRLEVVVGFSDGTLRAIRGAEPRARADQSAGVTKRPEQLIFGAPAYLDPAKLQEIYRPLMAYLTRELGLPCSLRVVPYRQVIMDLAGGRSQVAVLSPLSYVLARRRVPGLRLVASHLAASKSSFRGVVVVRDDSPYWRLADLRGKRIAYVDPDSTSGCLYPQAHLLSSGSDPRRFFDKVMFGQTHNGGVRLLLAGKVDAAATFGDALGSAAYHGNKTANLRVIDRTEPIPYDAYVARPEVPPDLVQALSNAFLRLNINTKEGRKILGRAMRIDGWLPPDDRRYDGVRRVLKLLERHGVR